MQTELRVLAGGGIAGPMRAIAPYFERSCGHRLRLHFGTTPELIREATSGAAFDAGVTPREVYADTAARSRFAPGPLVDIARVGLGLAVRAGAAKPNISTPDALKAVLLDARSLATIPASAAGAQILRVFDRLGISDAMAGKIQVKKAPPDIVQAVATGETELGMFLTNVFTAPGVELATPFPVELQQEVVFAAAIAVDAANRQAAEEFLAYLKSPDASALIEAGGMTPA
jgi:molybdate transport system substrate-binding protein